MKIRVEADTCPVVVNRNAAFCPSLATRFKRPFVDDSGWLPITNAQRCHHTDYHTLDGR